MTTIYLIYNSLQIGRKISVILSIIQKVDLILIYYLSFIASNIGKTNHLIIIVLLLYYSL